jgi:hypothetical protein
LALAFYKIREIEKKRFIINRTFHEAFSLRSYVSISQQLRVDIMQLVSFSCFATKLKSEDKEFEEAYNSSISRSFRFPNSDIGIIAAA